MVRLPEDESYNYTEILRGKPKTNERTFLELPIFCILMLFVSVKRFNLFRNRFPSRTERCSLIQNLIYPGFQQKEGVVGHTVPNPSSNLISTLFPCKKKTREDPTSHSFIHRGKVRIITGMTPIIVGVMENWFGKIYLKRFSVTNQT